MANLTDKLIAAEKVNAQVVGVMLVVGALASAAMGGTMSEQDLALRVIGQVCSPPYIVCPENPS